MTITIELTPTEEAALRAQAKRRGQEPESLLRDMVRTELAPTENGHAGQERLAQHLLAQGFIAHIPTGRVGPPPRPITVTGPPVSQTRVEQRR